MALFTLIEKQTGLELMCSDKTIPPLFKGGNAEWTAGSLSRNVESRNLYKNPFLWNAWTIL